MDNKSKQTEINLYQYTKTVRFKLDHKKSHINQEDFKLKPHSKSNNPKEKITKITKSLKEIFDGIEKIFFCDKETEFIREEYTKVVFSNKLKIKYEWLKTYTKVDFYNWEKQNSTIKIYSLKFYRIFIRKYLKSVSMKWIAIVKNLKYLNKQPLEHQRRRRQFAFVLRQLLKRTNFEFMKEFVKAIHNTNDSKIDKKLEELKKNIETIEVDLKNTIKLFLPSQTIGVELLRATFNYYTLNKSPKEYDDSIKKEKK